MNAADSSYRPTSQNKQLRRSNWLVGRNEEATAFILLLPHFLNCLFSNGLHNFKKLLNWWKVVDCHKDIHFLTALFVVVAFVVYYFVPSFFFFHALSFPTSDLHDMLDASRRMAERKCCVYSSLASGCFSVFFFPFSGRNTSRIILGGTFLYSMMCSIICN